MGLWERSAGQTSHGILDQQLVGVIRTWGLKWVLDWCVLAVALEGVDILDADTGAADDQCDNSLWPPGAVPGRAAANAIDPLGTDSEDKHMHHNAQKTRLLPAEFDSNRCMHRGVEAGVAFLGLGRANSRMSLHEEDRGTDYHIGAY
jgi:hypothetical protein